MCVFMNFLVVLWLFWCGGNFMRVMIKWQQQNICVLDHVLNSLQNNKSSIQMGQKKKSFLVILKNWACAYQKICFNGLHFTLRIYIYIYRCVLHTYMYIHHSTHNDTHVEKYKYRYAYTNTPSTELLTFTYIVVFFSLLMLCVLSCCCCAH